MNTWQLAIDNELVSTGIGIAKEDATLKEATAALNQLIDWHIAVATDPKVNGGYFLVSIESTKEMIASRD